jgi:hypothetical protein
MHDHVSSEAVEVVTVGHTMAIITIVSRTWTLGSNDRTSDILSHFSRNGGGDDRNDPEDRTYMYPDSANYVCHCPRGARCNLRCELKAMQR